MYPPRCASMTVISISTQLRKLDERPLGSGCQRLRDVLLVSVVTPSCLDFCLMELKSSIDPKEEFNVAKTV